MPTEITREQGREILLSFDGDMEAFKLEFPHVTDIIPIPEMLPNFYAIRYTRVKTVVLPHSNNNITIENFDAELAWMVANGNVICLGRWNDKGNKANGGVSTFERFNWRKYRDALTPESHAANGNKCPVNCIDGWKLRKI